MPEAFDDETLVAYLDGELSGEDATRVADQLVSDPLLRGRLDALKSTWNLLEDLPEVKLNPQLAQSTIELVGLQLEEEATKPNGWRRLGNPWVLLLSGVLAAYLAGLTVGEVLTATLADRLLNILPVVVDYDALQAVDSPQWLEELTSMPDLTEAFPGISIGQDSIPDAVEERADWVTALDVVDRGKLEDNLTDFREEPEERRKELREFAQRIYESPDRDHILECVRSYRALLNERSTLQAATLKALPIEQRRQRVEQLVNSKMLTLYATDMPTKDVEAIQVWINDQNFFPWLDLTEYSFLEDETVSEAALTSLANSLSDDARRLLSPLSADRRRLILGLWVMTILNPERVFSVTPEQMLETLASMTSEETLAEQERIQLLPEDEARSELRRKIGAPETE